MQSITKKYCYLICPRCHTSSLEIIAGNEHFKEFLICGDCKKEYPVYSEIPILSNRTIINGIDYRLSDWPLLERKKEFDLSEKFSLSDSYLLELPFPETRQDTTFQLKNGAMGHNFFEVVDKLTLKGIEKILDIGAGSCWTSYHFARKGCDVVAIDQRTIKYWGLRSISTYSTVVGDRLQGVCCDFDVLPFKDQYFDVVFINNAFQYAGSLDSFLREIRRVLKDDGRFVLSWTGTRGFLKSSKWGPGHNIIANISAIQRQQFSIMETVIPTQLFESVLTLNDKRLFVCFIAKLILPLWRRSMLVRYIFNMLLHIPISCFMGIPFNLIAIKRRC